MADVRLRYPDLTSRRSSSSVAGFDRRRPLPSGQSRPCVSSQSPALPSSREDREPKTRDPSSRRHARRERSR